MSVGEPTGLPRPDPARVAEAVEALADQVEVPDVRAQLVALAGIIRAMRPRAVPDEVRAALAAVAEADEAEDDAALVAALRAYATAEGRGAPRVDWTRASGG